MVVLDLSRLGYQEDALGIAMTCASAWLESTLAASGGLRWIIYDEAWRLLRSLPLIRLVQAQFSHIPRASVIVARTPARRSARCHRLSRRISAGGRRGRRMASGSAGSNQRRHRADHEAAD